MKSSTMNSVVIFLVVVLSGCAGTVGKAGTGAKEFVRVTDDALVLGQTTYEQIIARLGPPYSQRTNITKDKQTTTITYSYASTGGTSAVEDVIPARVQLFTFFNGNLVGYIYASSWKGESTDFDGGKVLQIKEGESTRSDVIRLLGNPGGKSIYPNVPNEDEDTATYLYTQSKRSIDRRVLKNYRKYAVFTFNKQGVVTKILYEESGER